MVPPTLTRLHLALTVNGERVEAAVDPTKTLLEVLREDLQLTGTKHGCELGECGACAVLLDGETVLSCLVLAPECGQRDVVTVEGLAQDGRLDPLQETFADLGAAQCGYCTPGILITARALLDREPQSVARADLRGAVRATCAAAPATCRSSKPWKRLPGLAGRRPFAGAARGERMSIPISHGGVVGKARRRVDGRAKVTGQTRFADDLLPPRTVHCRLLRSTVPHARIRSIDVSRARALDGVHLVLTGDDFPIAYGILPVSQDEHPLCRDVVRFVGDPVAAVIARDEQTATEALDLIAVDYEVLRTFASPEESLAFPEPRIHDYGDEGNVHKKVSLQFGDVDAALAGADHVFDDLFFFEGNTHLPIEQHATVAVTDPDGKLVVYSSTQTPHYLHRALAKALAMPAAHIRVVATPNGGGFGGKSDPFNHEIVVARAALRLDRPVKICLNREEVFLCHRGRHPVLMRFRTGVSRDGRIQGMHLQTLLDGGAYGSYGVASTFYTGALQTVTYQIPTYRFDGCRVFTNKPPCGPKRGHGTPQSRFGQEVQLDKIAERLKIDPADLRLGMIAPAHSLTANYLRIGTIGLAECIQRVVERSGWREKHGASPYGRGFGLACSSYLSGAGLPIYWNDMPHSGVQLKLDRSGGVTAFCGATEIGQGSDDVLVNCVAEVLGIDPFDIRAGHRRYRSHAGGSRLLLQPRHPDDGQRGHPGRRARPRPARRGGGAQARRAQGSAGLRRAPRLRQRGSGTRRGLRRGRVPRRSGLRHHRHHRLVHAGEERGEVQGRRRRTLADLLVHRGDRRGGGRSRDRLDRRAAGVDRPRHRQVAESRAGARPGRGQRLHGPRRGADGGAGVSPAAAAPLPRAGPQVPVDARVQEPDQPRHAGDLHRPGRGSAIPKGRSAPRKWARGRCCRSCRRWPTPSSTRWASAWTRSR